MGKDVEDALIVTSAVFSRDPYLTIKNHDIRLLQLYCSMICWITRTRIRNFILCDNTCTNNIFAELMTLAESYGKKLEVLCFQGDQDRVVVYGKGFGEGEIMQYIMDNSLLLREEGAFFKITGRVFVENFDEIFDSEKTRDTVFNLRMKRYKKVLWRIIARMPGASAISNLGLGYIQTIFYKCGVRYYREYLLECYKTVNDRKNYSFENRMFMPLMRNGFATFRITPRFVGQSAGTGELYGGSDFPLEVKEQADSMIAALGQRNAVAPVTITIGKDLT